MAAASSSEKRCLYEVLGLPTECSADEIRSAYRRLALQRHPDKLVQSGLSPAAATAAFQELSNAYEVLSDPRERSWYDSHRSQVLFSDPTSGGGSAAIPDLFSFFSNTVFSGYSDTPKGFYKVYSDVFDRIYSNEVNFSKKLGLNSVKVAPSMGNLESPYFQVKAFYDYWLGFMTVMDFCWVDQYDAMAGVNRKSRRVMEEENKKVRKKAKREFNEMVRGLAEFVKKRDKRVIDMIVKKEAELEKKRLEEREKRRERERERAERARAYEEPEWSRVDEEEIENGMKEFEGDDGSKKNGRGQEFYCVVCGKKFKSDKQWKNHEQSKKHKEKVAELRESFLEEDEKEEVEEEGQEDLNENCAESDHLEHTEDGVDKLNESFRKEDEEEEVEEESQEDLNENCAESNHLEHTKDRVDKLNGQFRDGFGIEEETNEAETSLSEEEVSDVRGGSVSDMKDVHALHDSDDEIGVLEAMVSGHRRRNKNPVQQTKQPSANEAQDETNGDSVDRMVYDNRKTRRRNNKERKGKGREFDRGHTNYNNKGADADRATEDCGARVNLNMEDASSHFVEGNNAQNEVDNQSERNSKSSNNPSERKVKGKQETDTKPKNSSKGRKQKATTKKSGNTCETCGEDFDSRNKLHKHLADEGHSSLKFR